MKKAFGIEVTPSRTLKTNSKFILKMSDKNLLQSNSHFDNYEIPIDGYFQVA